MHLTLHVPLCLTTGTLVETLCLEEPEHRLLETLLGVLGDLFFGPIIELDRETCSS